MRREAWGRGEVVLSVLQNFATRTYIADMATRKLRDRPRFDASVRQPPAKGGRRGLALARVNRGVSSQIGERVNGLGGTVNEVGALSRAGPRNSYCCCGGWWYDVAEWLSAYSENLIRGERKKQSW